MLLSVAGLAQLALSAKSGRADTHTRSRHSSVALSPDQWSSHGSSQPFNAERTRHVRSARSNRKLQAHRNIHATWTMPPGLSSKGWKKTKKCRCLQHVPASPCQKDCSLQLQNAAKSRSCLFDAALRSCEPVFRRRTSACGDKNARVRVAVCGVELTQELVH